jgi:hypothetical protein
MTEAALLQQRASRMKPDLQQRFNAALAKGPRVSSVPGSAVNDEASEAPPAAVNARIMAPPAAANSSLTLAGAAQVSRHCQFVFYPLIVWRCLSTQKPASISSMMSSNKQRRQGDGSQVMYGITHVTFACMPMLIGGTTAFAMIAVLSW